MSLYTGLGTETSSGSLVFKTSNAGSEGISGALMFSSGTTSSGASGVLEMGTGTATEGKGGYIRMTVGKTTTTNAEDGGVNSSCHRRSSGRNWRIHVTLHGHRH